MKSVGPESSRRRKWRAFVGLGAALAGMIVVVVAFDSLPGSRLARDQLWTLNTLHFEEFDRKLPARQATEWYVGVGPGELQPEATAPVIQPSGGLFSGPVDVTVAADADEASIRCSTDGSIPTQNHEVYVAPLMLSATTVVRCRSFRSGYQTSQITTQSYFIDIPAALPILAVTVHPANLWNRYTGIYQHFEEKGGEWERDAHVEYFPRTGESALAIEGRLRIHGGYSRSNAKKSFRFSYKPLPERMRTADNILTWTTPAGERAVVFGARESYVNRDELFQSLFAPAGGLTSAKMAVFLYLNGEPWGIYYVRERVDEEYLQRHFGRGRYDLLVSEPNRPRVMAGSRKNWEEMTRFLESNNLADPATFAVASQFVDIDNFIDYWLFNVYAANMDWPHHNMSMFRSRKGEDSRWRWICWDADATFDHFGQGLNHDTFAWATRTTLRHELRFNYHRGAVDEEDKIVATLLARKLLENAEYRRRLAGRMSELLDTHLHPDRVEQALLRQHAEIAPDLQLDWDRWDLQGDGSAAARAYSEDFERVRNFIRVRPAIVRAWFDDVEIPGAPAGAPEEPSAEAITHATLSNRPGE